MEQQNTGDLFTDTLQIDETAKRHFAGITSWCIVIVVVALIGYILNIADLVMRKPASPTRSEGFSFNLDTGRSPSGTIVALIIGLLLNFFLYRFAMQTQKAIATFDQARLNNGFSNLKTYFIFFSILMIIICLASLLIIPAILK